MDLSQGPVGDKRPLTAQGVLAAGLHLEQSAVSPRYSAKNGSLKTDSFLRHWFVKAMY
jgi:hypothetical protein